VTCSLAARPQAVPNRWIVELADEALGREGKLYQIRSDNALLLSSGRDVPFGNASRTAGTSLLFGMRVDQKGGIEPGFGISRSLQQHHDVLLAHILSLNWLVEVFSEFEWGIK